jgi:hypothetical protein
MLVVVPAPVLDHPMISAGNVPIERQETPGSAIRPARARPPLLTLRFRPCYRQRAGPARRRPLGSSDDPFQHPVHPAARHCYGDAATARPARGTGRPHETMVAEAVVASDAGATVKAIVGH